MLNVSCGSAFGLDRWPERRFAGTIPSDLLLPTSVASSRASSSPQPSPAQRAREAAARPKSAPPWSLPSSPHPLLRGGEGLP